VLAVGQDGKLDIAKTARTAETGWSTGATPILVLRRLGAFLLQDNRIYRNRKNTTPGPTI